MTPLLDPIVHPHVTVDGETFEVVFRICDAIDLLKEQQIDLFAPLANRPDRTKADEWDVVCVMLAYGLRHTGRSDLDLSPKRFLTQTFETFGEINQAVADARKKALAWATPGRTENGATPEPETSSTGNNGG